MGKSAPLDGLWPSPVTPDSLALALRLEELAWAGDGTLLWLEYRANRGVVVAAGPEGDAPRDLTDTHDVRARVGYGGGALGASADAALYVERNGRIYRQALDHGRASPITPPFGHAASPTVSPDGACALYVHNDGADDCLALCDLDARRWPQRLIHGADFYMQPTWHPNGDQIAWIEWDHPQMPWDGTRLCRAPLARPGNRAAEIGDLHHLAGDAHTSVSQPRYCPAGRRLAYLSDADGWSNLYLLDLQTGQHRQLTRLEADLGLPCWVQGVRTYGWAPDGQSIIAVENSQAFHRLVRIDTSGGHSTPLHGLDEFSDFRAPTVSPGGDRVAFIASSPRHAPRVVVWHDGRPHVLRRSSSDCVAPADLSAPRAVQWTAPDGTAVHGLLFPPHNRHFTGKGLPPAIVSIHGGPTSQVSAGYSPRAQFFATRGYAYLDVNYRGSTGYGRDYQRALCGRWGITDVQDALGAHGFLTDEGLADANRIAIIGGSAGGYTVLKTLVDHPGIYAAGLCLYGVSNLFTLATDTHKFEAYYLDSLVGTLPESAETYRERSPLFHADSLVDPIAIFQGSQDKVVPPDQSEAIVASLRDRGVPHEYHLYEGEEHGFRNPDTIRAFYRDVDRFLRQHVLYR